MILLYQLTQAVLGKAKTTILFSQYLLEILRIETFLTNFHRLAKGCQVFFSKVFTFSIGSYYFLLF